MFLPTDVQHFFVSGAAANEFYAGMRDASWDWAGSVRQVEDRQMSCYSESIDVRLRGGQIPKDDLAQLIRNMGQLIGKTLNSHWRVEQRNLGSTDLIMECWPDALYRPANSVMYAGVVVNHIGLIVRAPIDREGQIISLAGQFYGRFVKEYA